MLGLSPLSAAPVSSLAELTVSTSRFVNASSVIVLSQNGYPDEVARSLASAIVLSQNSLVPFVDVAATSGIVLANADSSAGQIAVSSIVIGQSAVTSDVYQTIEQSIYISSRATIRTGYLASGRYRR